jgi:hypothetical protein
MMQRVPARGRALVSDDQVSRAGAGLGPTPAPMSAAEVSDIVRDVISQMAPEELVVFDAVADAWVSETLTDRQYGRAPGAAVGFGVEAVLLSQLAFPIITGALGDVLGTAVTGRVSRRHRLTRPAVGAAPKVPEDHRAGRQATGEPAPPGGQLSGQQVQDLREACERHARTLGMSPAKADVLADAFLGSLRSVLGW